MQAVARVTAIVPTYNEIDNIQRLVPQLLQLDTGLVQLTVCIVDDSSPDGTGQLADRLAVEDTRVSVIHRAGKLGLGTAYIAGMRQACASDAGAALTMDADFSHHPRYIPSMIQALDSADLVIGSRYVRGGEVRYPFHRRFLSQGANAFARFSLGLKARDCTAGFRLYRREVIESIPLDSIFSNGYSCLIELLFHVQRNGWRIREVPIIFEDRRYGRSKISQSEIYRAMYTCLRLTARRAIKPARANPDSAKGKQDYASTQR